MLCGDEGPRYRTRRELVELFARVGVTIEEPLAGSRRQLALAGLTELHSRPNGLANIVSALTDDAPVVAERAERTSRDRSRALEEVLEQIRRRFGAVLTRPRATIGKGTYRPCFRLTLGETGTAWLDAHLQSTTDPSLVVPLEEVANAHSSALAFGRRSFSPATAVMAALVRAATLFEPIERIRPSHPWIELDEDELAVFIGRAARELTREGFGVILPTELTTSARRRLNLRVHVTAEQPTDGLSSGLNADTLASFHWKASIDDEELTAEEFDAIANAKRELVRWRGTWVLVDERDIANAQVVIGTTGSMPLVRAAGAALAGTAVVAGREAAIVPDTQIASLVERLVAATAPTELGEPTGFVGELRGYQARGLSWLSHLEASGFGGCLADDMGLGKTIMVIALALHDPRPTLVVCPTSVIGNWEREVQRFAPSLRVVRQHGSGRSRTSEALAERLDPQTIVLTSYGLLRRDRALFNGVEWGRVVLDEAQNVKNPTAQQTRAAFALHTRSRLALTGTPVENRLTDLWSIMQFCNPGLLGPVDEFVDRFAGPVERGDDEATDRLRKIVRPFVLRRVKSDPDVAPDLPEKFVSSVICPLTPEQATLYRATVDEVLDEVSSAQGIARRGKILALITALKQICDHPAVFLKQSGPLAGRSGKTRASRRRCSKRLSRRERPLSFSRSTRRWDDCSRRTSPISSASSRCSCTAGRHAPREIGWSSGSRRRTDRRSSCCRSKPEGPG